MTDPEGSPAWRRPWIKLWVEMLDDPKYLDLGPAQQAAWVNLLLATTRSPEPGKMLRPNGRPMSAEQVRTAVRAHAMSPAEFQSTLEEMESMGMVHWEDGALTVTNWHRRQDPEDPAQRMRRYRERLREGNGHALEPGDGTTPVTERNAQSNATGTPGPHPVAPAVTERNAATGEGVTGGVTKGNRPFASPASNQLRSRPGPDVTGGVTLRNTRGVEGGGAKAPPQKTRRQEYTPSGANAPSGAAPNVSPGDGTSVQLEGHHQVPDESSSPSPAKDGGGTAPRLGANGEQDSSPSTAKDGGDIAAPRATTSRDEQDSGPGSHRDGGAQRPPRAMTGRPSADSGRSRKTVPIRSGQVDGVLQAIQDLWGQPIVHWAKEAHEVKAALATGYQPEQVLACWKAAQESPRWKGRWMPLAYLVEDLGEFVKSGGRPLRKWMPKAASKEDGSGAEGDSIPSAEEWRARRGRW